MTNIYITNNTQKSTPEFNLHLLGMITYAKQENYIISISVLKNENNERLLLQISCLILPAYS